MLILFVILIVLGLYTLHEPYTMEQIDNNCIIQYEKIDYEKYDTAVLLYDRMDTENSAMMKSVEGDTLTFTINLNCDDIEVRSLTLIANNGDKKYIK